MSDTHRERLFKSLVVRSKADHLRDLANEMRLSAGILNECATLFDDIDAFLGSLAECFDEAEEEFSDIRDMRGRIRGELVAPSRPAHEPPPDYLQKREPIRRILFEELFVDSRAQDYKDAAVRLWTEQYQLVARVKELEAHCEDVEQAAMQANARAAQPPGAGREHDIESFIAGVRWCRMASVGGNHLNEALIDKDAAYFADSGGNIRCRSAPTKRSDDAV
jgi:hypothetical protein